MKRKFIERYDDKPLYKDKAYLPVLFVFLLIFGLFGYTLYVDYNSEVLNSNTGFKGSVNEVFYQKSIYYIKLSNQIKWLKLKNIKNKNYPELDDYFMDIIEKGDSISKKINTDTIELIKSKKRYFFIVEEYIN